VPGFAELGVVDIHALTMALKSGIYAEIRVALDISSTAIGPWKRLPVRTIGLKVSSMGRFTSCSCFCSFAELGVVDIHALTMALKSGIYAEIRVALDTLTTLFANLVHLINGDRPVKTTSCQNHRFESFLNGSFY
jgi:hypothetical protein